MSFLCQLSERNLAHRIESHSFFVADVSLFLFGQNFSSSGTSNKAVVCSMTFFSFVKGSGILALSGYRKRTPHGQQSLMVKCPLGCFLVYSSLLVARMRESVCTNRDFFASPSVHAEIRQGCQLSDTFRVGIRDVFHCWRHKDYYVAQLDSGRIVGNSRTSRMEALSVSSMTRRSTPKPRPPVGGRPYSRALT